MIGEPVVRTYSRLPITRTFTGNRKKVGVIGSSKKIAGTRGKRQFLLHSEHFYRNVKGKLKDTSRL